MRPRLDEIQWSLFQVNPRALTGWAIWDGEISLDVVSLAPVTHTRWFIRSSILILKTEIKEQFPSWIYRVFYW
jgi:hypothetical protein